MSTLNSRIAAIVPTITGWCSVEKAQDLALAIIKCRSTVSIEVGVWAGRSVIPMALAHQEQNHGVVWAIDPWSPAIAAEGYDKVNADWWGAQNHELVYQNFLRTLKANGLEQFVKVFRNKSDDVEPPEEVGCLHLDGKHNDQTVTDVERYATKVIPGGFCYIDDIHWSGGGVERGVEKLLSLGFVKLFDRDTGAMFQRVDEKLLPKRTKKVVEAKALVVEEKKKRGWPKGKKRGKKVAAK